MTNQMKWRIRVVLLAVPELFIQLVLGLFNGAGEACVNIRDAWKKEV